MILTELLSGRQSLYVYRPLINNDDIRQWAASQGFTMTLADDMHVTIAFSKTPVDWQQFTPQPHRLIVRGGERRVGKLGDKGAVVLSFPARLLRQRWQTFCDGGASWDWDEYHPHVTVTYQGDHLDLTQIEPYRGDLIFGPEKFAVVQDDWDDKISEEPVTSTPSEVPQIAF